MGGSESFVDNYIKQHGVQALFRLILLKKKIIWLQDSCSRQINRKVDDEIRYILFQMDEYINQKKALTLQQYKNTKSQIIRKQPARVSTYEKKHGRSLQNIYGKNHVLDKLNLLKINFHIEVHIGKKKVKKSIQEKIGSMQNHLLYCQKGVPISKQTIEMLFKEEKKSAAFATDNPESIVEFEEFKKQVIQEFNFNSLFWPHFEIQIRQTRQETDKAFNQVEKNTKTMRKDLEGNWTAFTFQSA